MNAFAISSILIFIANLMMAVLMLFKSGDRKLTKTWILMSIGSAIWGFGAYKFSTTQSKEIAFFWWQFAYIGGVFCPAIFFHFICKFINLKKKNLIALVYALAFFFFAIILTKRELFFGDLRLVFGQFYCFDWPKYKSPIFLVFYIGFYWILLLYTLFLMLVDFRHSSGIRRMQMKYFIIASIIGWIGPHSFFPSAFRIEVYPYPYFFLAVYPLIITYAIMQHQLMDINIIIKKGLVYSALLAIITAGYLIFVVSVGKLFQGMVGYQSFFSNLFAVFIIAALLYPLRDWIQHILDKRFFQGTLESLDQERCRLQQELFHKEKLAYVGQLASSIVHEIRNPLTAIKTHLDYLPQKYHDAEFRQKFNTLIPKEVERIEKVINQLLNLAKPRQVDLKPVNVCALIDSTLTLLQDSFALKKISIKKDYQDPDGLIQGDEEQLKQVFLNLFLNAIQAMGEGGELFVQTTDQRPETKDQKPTSADQKSLVFGLESQVRRDYVRIIIADNGCGISPENLKKLFEPFHTTKRDGIGLGLSITQEIIKLHGGTIAAESKLGEGTKFTIELPKN